MASRYYLKYIYLPFTEYVNDATYQCCEMKPARIDDRYLDIRARAVVARLCCGCLIARFDGGLAAAIMPISFRVMMIM